MLNLIFANISLVIFIISISFYFLTLRCRLSQTDLKFSTQLILLRFVYLNYNKFLFKIDLSNNQLVLNNLYVNYDKVKQEET